MTANEIAKRIEAAHPEFAWTPENQSPILDMLAEAARQGAEDIAERVRHYADDRRAHGSRATVGSWRIASDLYGVLGEGWPE